MGVGLKVSKDLQTQSNLILHRLPGETSLVCSSIHATKDYKCRLGCDFGFWLWHGKITLMRQECYILQLLGAENAVHSA